MKRSDKLLFVQVRAHFTGNVSKNEVSRSIIFIQERDLQGTEEFPKRNAI